VVERAIVQNCGGVEVMRQVLAILVLPLMIGPGRQSGAQPPATPAKFLMATNGLMGASQGVLLQDGVLVYTQHATNGTSQQKTIAPSPDQWRQFRRVGCDQRLALACQLSQSGCG
jgi:hypothetical protein